MNRRVALPLAVTTGLALVTLAVPATATTVSAAADVRVVLSINGLLVLVLGIVPGALMALCAQAVKSMLAL